ncbi:hypothetical protein [Halorussus halophilus]|uniref:hypothetical protein n=1 Tax=Halorussus halophilus TaxID=2650975 RepID=UPI0013014B20|nr:hypothetical protein [Halorussus halophilus]
MTVNANANSLKNLSTVSTVIDAALAFARGRTKSGMLLLGAAALSSKIPGIGTATSLLVRLVRWLR